MDYIHYHIFIHIIIWSQIFIELSLIKHKLNPKLIQIACKTLNLTSIITCRRIDPNKNRQFPLTIINSKYNKLLMNKTKKKEKDEKSKERKKKVNFVLDKRVYTSQSDILHNYCIFFLQVNFHTSKQSQV